MQCCRNPKEIRDLQFGLNIEEIDTYLDLWLTNKVEKLWKEMSKLSLPEFAYVTAWITYMLSAESDVSLSQWIVWLETKAKAENR